MAPADPGQPLEGIRVLELAQGIQGPYCGKLLADFGADVVKAEPPAGDVARRHGPFPTAEPEPEQSALFLHCNTNKRGITLDPGTPGGRDLLHRLVGEVDVVIESEAPGTLARWGLDEPALESINPRLVLTSVTPFGQDGPYAGYKGEEIVYYAMGGPMNSTGLDEREPVKLGGSVVSYQAGNLAATATLAAVLVAEQSGEGAHIDVSSLESQEGSVDRRLAFLTGYAYNGGMPSREGTQRLSPAPMGVYPCADGYVQIITIPAWVPRMLATLQDDELDRLYADPGWMVDPEVPEASDGVLYPWLFDHSRNEAMLDAQRNAWPVTAVNSPADVVADAHYDERGYFVEVDHPAAGTIRQPGPQFRMAGGWQLRRPAPLLGQHNDEVYRDGLGLGDAELAELRAARAI